jgi:signal transduction histidine kinase
VADAFDAAMRDATTSRWGVEYRFRCGDGRYATVAERGAVLRSGDGRPVRCIGTMLDVSDREELAAQLRQSQKMEAVGQLAGGIAHDFNNLLTAISCNVELLLDEIPTGDPHHDDVVQIREAAGRAAALTRQLLAFSRRQVLQPTSLDLNATVGNMDRLLRRVLSADVQLHTELDPAVSTVFADAGQMEQVVMNLVLNARDAMPAGGSIVVGTAPVHLEAPLAHHFGVVAPGRYVALSVRDVGTGIPADVLGRLFEPFFTTKAHGKGTGLGLATVHGIVSQSNGQIVVETAVGMGTTFTVYLPVDHPQTGGARPAIVAPRRDAGSVGGRTVLVVDDEPAVRDVTMRAIARSGYRVIGASRGADALALLQTERDHASILLLTDVMMPEMNGHELAAIVEQRHPEVLIACMSGFSSEEIARHGLAASTRRLLHKPFALPDLVAFVEELFSLAATAA